MYSYDYHANPMALTSWMSVSCSCMSFTNTFRVPTHKSTDYVVNHGVKSRTPCTRVGKMHSDIFVCFYNTSIDSSYCVGVQTDVQRGHIRCAQN